jgi:G3E family GTPase
MNNGCICCTVRGDLIRILNKILSRKSKMVPKPTQNPKP